MRSLEEREYVLNLYFHEGMGYKGIASTTGIPLDTIKSWCRRYRTANEIPERGKTPLSREPIRKETVRVIKPRDTTTPEARIARLEMEVELLRNFLIAKQQGSRDPSQIFDLVNGWGSYIDRRKVKKSRIFSVINRFSDKYSISQMCDFYNVSRQGFYDYRKCQQKKKSDEELIDMIIECQKANKNRLGYRRVKKWLKREKGLNINEKRVYRITRQNNLLSVIRRRKTLKYKTNGNLKYENILNRRTHSDMPNKDWVTDISYIVMPDGTAYLSAIRDLCGQFVVAYKTAQRQDYSLVKNTISDAMQSEKPDEPPLLHSDGGGQYRSYDHKKVIEEYGITPSMSKPATPGDNAMAENFFSIFKTECIYLEKPKTLDEALKLTEEFLQYYNYERIKGNGLTPYEERQLAFERQRQNIASF